jgi:hypothetical protein
VLLEQNTICQDEEYHQQQDMIHQIKLGVARNKIHQDKDVGNKI